MLVPEYLDVSYGARQVEYELREGLVSLSQFTARRYRARMKGDVELCLDMAVGYELYMLNRVKED